VSDRQLVEQLRKRAANDRKIQANNEVIAAALRGQRILFDEGHRSDTNTFAVRMALDHENCAKNDAKLAADWDAAADRIDVMVRTKDRIQAKVDELKRSGYTSNHAFLQGTLEAILRDML
jgi:hypothetical protein